MNVNFHWKRPILSMNNFESVFQEFWPQIKKKIVYRTHVLQNSHFWAKLSLTACWTFVFSKFVYIWFLILHVRIQSLKEFWVVATESFWIELIEAIVYKCSKKGVFEILEELTRKHPHQNTTSDNWVQFGEHAHRQQIQKFGPKTVHAKLRSTLYWCFHWIKVRDTEICGVKPKWIYKRKIKCKKNLKEKPNIKIQKLI